MSALQLTDLTVERGGRPVVRQVSIEIPAGQVTALLGPNGAGKSTLVLAVGGVLKPKAGSVLLDAPDSSAGEITGRRPERIRQAGVAIVPEGRRLLPDLTVEDNLRVASYALTREQAQAGREKVLELFPQLTQRLAALARTLSGGEQQMVVLAQALIGQPRYLLIDELSLGLAPVVVSRLIPVIAAVAESGTGVLLIEQFATVALGLANHAHIMEGGRIRFSGPSSELRDNPALLRSAYLLRGSTDQPPAVAQPPAVIPDLFWAERYGLRAPGRVLHHHGVSPVDDQGLPVAQRPVRDALGPVPRHDQVHRLGLGVPRRPVVRHERLVKQSEPVPDRFRAVGPRDRAGVVHQLKPSQARRQHARPGAVPGVDQRVRREQIGEHRVAAAAPQRVAQHERVAAAQPGHAGPAQILTKALPVAEVVAQVQLDRVKAQAGELGQLILHGVAAHPGRRRIHRVRDDHRAAPRLTGQRHQMLRMIAHPVRRQVQPHSSLPRSPDDNLRARRPPRTSTFPRKPS